MPIEWQYFDNNDFLDIGKRIWQIWFLLCPFPLICFQAFPPGLQAILDNLNASKNIKDFTKRSSGKTDRKPYST
jgi:hypothetical protein